MIKRLDSLANMFGIDVAQGLATVASLPGFFRQRKAFRKALGTSGSLECDFPVGKLYPCLSDDTDDTGSAAGHYFHQDLLVARRMFEQKPDRHVDVGSRIDGCDSHVACFREIEVFDIRPLASNVRNLVFRQADLMSELPDEFIGCCDSLSCLHTLEHFGLGCYGDPSGHLVGFTDLSPIVSKGACTCRFRRS